MSNVVTPAGTGYREQLITEHMVRLHRLTAGGVPSSEMEVTTPAVRLQRQRREAAARRRAEAKIERIERWRAAIMDLRELQNVGPVRLSIDKIRALLKKSLAAADVDDEPALLDTGTIPTVRDICMAVCAHYGLDLIQFASRQRAARLARPRHVAIYLASKMTRNSLVTIGTVMQREHTSVCHSVRLVKKEMFKDPQLADEVKAIMARVREQRQEANA